MSDNIWDKVIVTINGEEIKGIKTMKLPHMVPTKKQYHLKTMVKQIFKYQLETTDIQEVEMPLGTEILCIQTQNERPCIWALVEPKAPLTKKPLKYSVLVTIYLTDTENILALISCKVVN